MKDNIGLIIKKLRKERNLTQEELAEQLGVTSQAVSKWENGYGLPDISQVIPLASVFNVSTDVLFGLYEKNTDDEVQSIIDEAHEFLKPYSSRETVKKCYDRIQDGIRKYPNNIDLLVQSLESALTLADPESRFYDEQNGRSIYLRSIREANVIIKNSKNITFILRAHTVMTILHSAYGNFDAASDHSEKLPWNTSMTALSMKAVIAHSKKDFATEKALHQKELLFHVYSAIDDIFFICRCCFNVGDYEKAEYSCRKALELIDFFMKEEKLPSYLIFSKTADISLLLSEICIRQEKAEEALAVLEKTVDFENDSAFAGFMSSPLFSSIEYPTGNKMKTDEYKENIKNKLDLSVFDIIRSEDRFISLYEKLSENKNND